MLRHDWSCGCPLRGDKSDRTDRRRWSGTPARAVEQLSLGHRL